MDIVLVTITSPNNLSQEICESAKKYFTEHSMNQHYHVLVLFAIGEKHSTTVEIINNPNKWY